MPPVEVLALLDHAARFERVNRRVMALSGRSVYDRAGQSTKTLKELEARGWFVAVARNVGSVLAKTMDAEGLCVLSIPGWRTATLTVEKLPEIKP